MSVNEQHVMKILSDGSKSIKQDLIWHNDLNHPPAMKFRAEVATAGGYPLFAHGQYNPMAKKLSYALIYRGVGRIYALDLGVGHRNPRGERLGTKHKHRWSDHHGDRVAYVPDDITAPWNQPTAVWEQFCREAKIHHFGTMVMPFVQQELPL